jgi:hypothetical protein
MSRSIPVRVEKSQIFQQVEEIPISYMDARLGDLARRLGEMARQVSGNPARGMGLMAQGVEGF